MTYTNLHKLYSKYKDATFKPEQVGNTLVSLSLAEFIDCLDRMYWQDLLSSRSNLAKMLISRETYRGFKFEQWFITTRGIDSKFEYWDGTSWVLLENL